MGHYCKEVKEHLERAGNLKLLHWHAVQILNKYLQDEYKMVEDHNTSGRNSQETFEYFDESVGLQAKHHTHAHT